MQQLSRGKHNKIRWVLSNYAQNLCCNLRGVVNSVHLEERIQNIVHAVSDPIGSQPFLRQNYSPYSLHNKINKPRSELSDDDKLIYVNHVLKGKLLESDTLAQ